MLHKFFVVVVFWKFVASGGSLKNFKVNFCVNGWPSFKFIGIFIQGSMNPWVYVLDYTRRAKLKVTEIVFFKAVLSLVFMVPFYNKFIF